MKVHKSKLQKDKDAWAKAVSPLLDISLTILAARVLIANQLCWLSVLCPVVLYHSCSKSAKACIVSQDGVFWRC